MTTSLKGHANLWVEKPYVMLTIQVSLVTIGIAMVFLTCHVTSREHMFKGLCECMSGSSSR